MTSERERNLKNRWEQGLVVSSHMGVNPCLLQQLCPISVGKDALLHLASSNPALSTHKCIFIIFLQLLCANGGNTSQTEMEVSAETDTRSSRHPSSRSRSCLGASIAGRCLRHRSGTTQNCKQH